MHCICSFNENRYSCHFIYVLQENDVVVEDAVDDAEEYEINLKKIYSGYLNRISFVQRGWIQH